MQDQDALWQAIITNDRGYDGRFFYAVKTTGVFCRPSCKSRVPSRANVEYFNNVTEALIKGYRPCKRCRPDLPVPYQPDRDVVDKACALLEAEFGNTSILEELPGRVGFSKFYFSRVFKEHIGKTPREYLLEMRIGKARELLLTTALTVTQICYEAGFTSLSNFYALFQASAGMSPKRYRHKNKVSAD
jgi:AraC family transcriptional regulator of adaptative response / methylphosphotriester-DNA alkyltransferase methyltransferase